MKKVFVSILCLALALALVCNLHTQSEAITGVVGFFLLVLFAHFFTTGIIEATGQKVQRAK